MKYRTIKDLPMHLQRILLPRILTIHTLPILLIRTLLILLILLILLLSPQLLPQFPKAQQTLQDSKCHFDQYQEFRNTN
jgi:hypothetical protein